MHGIAPVTASALRRQSSSPQVSKLASFLSQTYRVLQSLLSLCCAVLVVVDVTNNNWEVIDYIGNAKYLLAPLLNVPTKKDLEDRFTFPPLASPDTASDVGQFMINYTLSTAYNRDANHYYLTAGSYMIQHPAMDLCGMLVQSYPLPPSNATTMRLGVAYNHMYYVRGSTLENFFGPPHYPQPNATHRLLVGLGYVPTLTEVDMRLTTALDIPSTIGDTKSTNVSMYRFSSRSFCSGCDPIVQLGLVTCGINYQRTLTGIKVASSKAHYGEYHQLGLILDRSAATIGSMYIRGICVFFLLVSYTASKKTVRWTDATAFATWWKRIIHTISPPLYRYTSDAFSLSNFCLNSDLFVMFYVIAVLLDEKNSTIYSRAMYNWNEYANDKWVPIQIFSMQFRWLWINCCLVKVIKVVINYISMTRFSGSNVLVGLCNFSSETFVFIASILLLNRTEFIEHGNSDVVVLTSPWHSLDGIRVDFFDSWYMRAYPGFILVLIINLFMVLSLDRLINFKMWRRLAKNSLGRQFMFNSTSIMTEMCYEFHDANNYSGQAVRIQARTLCTLQWFLMCHTRCFGLPENPTNVRAVVSRFNGSPKKTTPSASVVSSSVSSYDVFKRKSSAPQQYNQSPLDNVKETDEDATDQSSTSKLDQGDLFILVQDPDGIIHMYDSRKQEIQSMSLEVKILGDSRYVIG